MVELVHKRIPCLESIVNNIRGQCFALLKLKPNPLQQRASSSQNFLILAIFFWSEDEGKMITKDKSFFPWAEGLWPSHFHYFLLCCDELFWNKRITICDAFHHSSNNKIMIFTLTIFHTDKKQWKMRIKFVLKEDTAGYEIVLRPFTLLCTPKV